MAENKKHTKIINALTKAGKALTAGELAQACGIAGSELSANVKELMKLGLIEKDPTDQKKVRLVKAKKATTKTAPAKAAAGKAKVKPAPEPEEDEDDEDEDEDDEEGQEDDEYTSEELDAFYAEYQELGAKAEKKPLKGEDKERFGQIEELLEEAGYFGPGEDEEGEDEEEDDEDAEEEFDFDDDEEDDEDEDDEPVPAKKSSKKATPKKPFTLDFKAINTLTEEELTDGIEQSLEACEELHNQGFGWAADFLYRSIVKARKQLERFAE